MTEQEALRRLEAISSGKWRAEPDLDGLEAELRVLIDCRALGTALRGWAAYRLGHVLVRQAHARGDDELLYDADEHFTAAARAGVFGAWPDLYKVALRLRLGQGVDGAVARLRERIQRTCEEPTQDHVVNALEALMYATGGDPSIADGLGSPHKLGGGAFLVAHPEPLPDVRMDWELAVAEVRDRADRQPELFAFLLGPGGDRARLPGGSWQPIRRLTLHLLAVRCRLPRASRRDLVLECDPDQPNRSDRMRRRVARARADLDGVLELGPELELSGAPVLGAVFEETYWKPQ